MQVFVNQHTYCAALEKRGYTKLGGGLYSEVYAKGNSDRVIKVGRAGNSWPDYVEWATINGYAGKFAPKVYSLKFHDRFYVAVMERLVATIGQLNAACHSSNANPFYEQYQATKYWAGSAFGDPMEGCEDLMAFCVALGSSGHATDLHDGNMMIRHDGQIVVTDPSSRGSFNYNIRIQRGSVTNASN